MYYDYKTKKLKDHPAAQCYVRLYDNGDICLRSYRTDVVYYRHGSGKVYCTGTYSPTTRKQIGWFLREYIPQMSYQDCKKMVAEGLSYNLRVPSSVAFALLTPKERTLITYSVRECILTPEDFDWVEE